MAFIKDFSELGKADAPIAGGKGASLGEMTQAGIPVPSGFVVLSAAFERFLEETDLNVEIDAILDSVNHKEIHTVEHASEKIQSLILNATIPEDIEKAIQEYFHILNTPYVAVRSSATAEDSASAAWAGQLDSFLNTTEETLIKNVKHCWASLFTPRAIFYRFEKSLHTTKISVAVVIQKMVESEVSGIAFSVHPVTEDRNQLIIEAGFGLGEAIVSGTITPDSYVVEKEPRRIIDTNISTQTKAFYRKEAGGNVWRDIPEPKASSQVLTESQILELSEIILTIENHYGFPCDIEWAYEQGRFFIVQSRPITTLMHNDSAPSDTRSSIPDFIHRVTFLASRPQSVQRDEAVYVFLEKWKHLGIGVVSIPLEGLNRALYAEKTSIDTIYKEVIAGISTEQGLDGHLRTYEKLMVEYQEVIRMLRSVDSQKEHLKSAFGLFIEACVKLTDYVWAPFTIDTDFGVLFREKLKKESGDKYESILEGVSSPTRFHEYQNMRLAMCEYVINGDDMCRAAADLTEKYAWYGEYSYVEKLYDEEYFQTELAKLTLESAADEKKKLNDDLQENVSRYNNALSKINDPTTRVYAKIINQYVFLRTDRIDSFKKLQTALRNVFGKIAENLRKETGEIWNMGEVVSMTNEEILNYLESVSVPAKKEMARRVRRYVYYRNPQITRVLTDEKEMSSIIDVVLSSVGQDEGIKGLVAYKGVVRGRAVTVFSKDDLHKVTDGSILVARTTMVDYISAMEKAVAFVTEEGGVTSHAAIVARELKKPCIVGTGNCTRVLKDGDLVEVDADNGVVRIIPAQAFAPDSKLRSLVTRKYVPLISDLFIQAYADVETYQKIFFTDYYVRVAYVSGKYCYGPESMDFGRHLYDKFKKDKGYFDRMFTNIYTHGEELYAVAVSLAERDYGNIKKEEVLKLASDFFETYKTFSISLLGFCIQYPVEEQLRHIAERAANPDEALSFLSFPEKENLSAFEQNSLYEIGAVVVAEKVSSHAALSDKTKDLLTDHANEYGWINARGGLDENWSPEDIYDRIAKMDVDFAKKFKENIEGKKEHKRESEEYLRNLDLSGEEMEIVKIAKELVYFRTYRTDYLNRVMSTAKPLLRVVAKLLNVSFKDLMHLRICEILNEDIPSKQEIKNRKGGYFLATIEPNSTVFSSDPKEITEFKERFIDESMENEDDVRGTAAYKGKVQGRVKLIMQKADFDRVTDGDILVTEMTTPNMISIMQRAAAFVTDEGGITCHAAIIAREMKKPCIIGTKIATRALKDGDLVEVDADSGVVRILK